MRTIGARIAHVAPGEIDLELAYDARLTQQNGFLHAGVVGGALDSACGYAALTLAEPGVDVLTVEFKLDLLEPAAGDRVVAQGRVIRSGRTLTVCRGEAMAYRGEERQLVAALAATMFAVRTTR
jgi:uncharacterized protein (TIGR00369 family)